MQYYMDMLEFCSDDRYNFFNNFVSYVWLCGVFTAVLGIPPAVVGRGASLVVAGRGSLAAAGRGASLGRVRAAHRGAYSGCRSRALCARASVAGPPAPEFRLSGGGSRAYLPCHVWDLPRPGTEPVSPALADSLPLSHQGNPIITLLMSHLKFPH